MTEKEERLRLVEDAIIELAILRDPAAREFPPISNDPRVKRANQAEHRVIAIAKQIAGIRGTAL